MVRNIRLMKFPAPMIPPVKRVVAYVRVSSGKESMLHSLSSQISYYSSLIQKNPGWAYVGVYSDEAITGTKDDRAEFQRLLANCRAGDIDMVITKSISRFARNTVTLLETVRELKALNVDVLFEKENIHSISGDGELMLTILASYAQEESRSTSENCKWRIKKMFEDGRASCATMMGYRLVDGDLQIVPEEAVIIRRIFSDFLSGMGRIAIAKSLQREGVKTRKGGTWAESTIEGILKNEKYVGDLLLQKTYVSNHIDKKRCINRGKLPMYFVKENHKPIVGRDTFERVQAEFQKRGKSHHHASKERPKNYSFSSKITCTKCGKHYRRKISNASTPYAKPVWICSTFNRSGKGQCDSKQIPEATLLSLTAGVLGLSKFDETIFQERIKEIVIPEPNKVLYKFRGGHEVEAIWQDKSRQESWTDEAKQLARDRRIQQQRGRANENGTRSYI